jgi:hypothetical protein
MRNIDYHITGWPETNEVEIMYTTPNSYYVKRVKLYGIPVDTIAKLLIERKIEKEKLHEVAFAEKLCIGCIWEFNKESIISKLPRDIMRLLTEKYICSKKEPKWLPAKHEKRRRRRYMIQQGIFTFMWILIIILGIIQHTI